MYKAIILALLVGTSSAFAQSHQPYAGFEKRAIKAMSEQQIADLRAARGMGLAIAAELNGYPGPMHVLEHADALALTAEQRKRTTALIESMKGEAVPLGEHLIEQEAELDRLFASRQITPTTLASMTDAIGQTQARLRRTHLKYHLAMMEVLSADQVQRYGELRGYGSRAHRPHSHH